MITSTAEKLDDVRAVVLRVTLRAPLLRDLFRVRSRRLGVLFLLSAALSLLLALAFPLWVLALGPVIYGVPHVFASMRFFHYTAGAGSRDGARKLALGLISAVMCAIFSYRLLVSANLLSLDVKALSEWKGSTYLELAGLLVTYLACARIYGRSALRVAAGLALLAPLFYLFTRMPAETVGALVLIHNFVAFAYWILAAKSSAERRVALGATLATTLLTAMIFAGLFDGLSAWLQPSLELPLANLRAEDVGRLLFPWSIGGDPDLVAPGAERLWLHGVMAYAFGQNLHYYVWLKAIPDQHHYHEVPTSFRQSLRFLEADFGSLATPLVLALSAGFAFLALFLAFPQVRAIYFSMAAFHGYLEIAGLALALRLSLEKA